MSDENDSVKFVGVGSPDEIRADRIQRIKKSKNRKAARVAQAVRALLVDAGLTRADFRAITARQAAPKKPTKYEWKP